METGLKRATGSVDKLVSRASVSSTPSTHWRSQRGAAPGSRPRRNEPSAWLPRCFQTSQLLLLLVFLACCLPLSSASPSPYDEIDSQMVEVVKDDVAVVDVGSTAELLKSSLDRLARTGTLLVDHSPEPQRWNTNDDNTNPELRRRQDPFGSQPDESKSKSTTSKAAKATPTTNAPSSPSKTASSGNTVVTQQTSFQLPIPYDQGFSGNITESCSNFMYGFLRNSTFQSCLPFSMLVLNSNSFFAASKSAFTITQTLDATCSADTTVCNPLIASLAANISTPANCASDIATGNTLIQQAQLGLKAYKPLYSASCLRNPQTSSYCFADAITNSTNPTDSHLYYLPLNYSLPGGSQPTCNACLKSSMAIFSAAASDRSSAIANTYITAAQQINVQCGPGFVSSSLAAEVKSSASSFTPGFASSNLGILALLMILGGWLL